MLSTNSTGHPVINQFNDYQNYRNLGALENIESLATQSLDNFVWTLGCSVPLICSGDSEVVKSLRRILEAYAIHYMDVVPFQIFQSDWKVLRTALIILYQSLSCAVAYSMLYNMDDTHIHLLMNDIDKLFIQFEHPVQWTV